jgi:hypothetical protein
MFDEWYWKGETTKTATKTKIHESYSIDKHRISIKRQTITVRIISKLNI